MFTVFVCAFNCELFLHDLFALLRSRWCGGTLSTEIICGHRYRFSTDGIENLSACALRCGRAKGIIILLSSPPRSRGAKRNTETSLMDWEIGSALTAETGNGWPSVYFLSWAVWRARSRVPYTGTSIGSGVQELRHSALTASSGPKRNVIIGSTLSVWSFFRRSLAKTYHYE